MDDHGSPALRRLIADLPEAVLETHAVRGEATARVDATRIVDVARLLHEADELSFEMLTDVTCVDYLGEDPRFEMVYHFYSVARNHRVRIKARVSEASPEIASLASLYASADWMEREVWDMYGIRFEGHPNLKRLLLYEEFQGHPLRKDYPKEKRQPLVGPRN